MEKYIGVGEKLNEKEKNKANIKKNMNINEKVIKILKYPNYDITNSSNMDAKIKHKRKRDGD